MSRAHKSCVGGPILLEMYKKKLIYTKIYKLRRVRKCKFSN